MFMDSSSNREFTACLHSELGDANCVRLGGVNVISQSATRHLTVVFIEIWKQSRIFGLLLSGAIHSSPARYVASNQAETTKYHERKGWLDGNQSRDLADAMYPNSFLNS
jgi:hypothetical protein